MKVAVTGGLSCGKSSVCRIFQELGAHVVSADAIVHRLLSPHHNIGQEVIRLLGQDIIVDGKINRAVIARKVFDNPTLLRHLEGLLHPAVREAVEEEYQQALPRGTPLFVVEIPLLFETGSEQFYDATIAVIADDKVCRERFYKATGQSDHEFDKRMGQQLSQKEKANKAKHIIVNNGDILQLKQAVKSLYEQLVL